MNVILFAVLFGASPLFAQGDPGPIVKEQAEGADKSAAKADAPAKVEAPAKAESPTEAEAPAKFEAPGKPDKAESPVKAAPPAKEEAPAKAAPAKSRALEKAEAEAPAAQTPPRKSPVEAELAFLKAVLEDKELDIQEDAVEEARALAAREADKPAGPEARLLLGHLLRQKGDWQEAVVAYLGFLYEYPDPDAALYDAARKGYFELVDKNMSSRFVGPKLAAPMKDLARIPDKPRKEDRLAAMLRGLVDVAGKELFDAIQEEFEDFHSRFTGCAYEDKVQVALADLYAKNGKNSESLHALRRVMALHPEGMEDPKARWQAAQLYADSLKKYDKAVEGFKDLVRRYPKSQYVVPSLERVAQLQEERLKDYPAALDSYDRIVKLADKASPGEQKALQAKARLQRDRLKQYAESVETFKKLAQDCGAPAGVPALQEAAEVARKNIKDASLEAQLRGMVAELFPKAEQAPEELFNAGKLFEDSLKDDANAKEAYQKLSAKYPTHDLAKKAAERLEKIEKRAEKQAAPQAAP